MAAKLKLVCAVVRTRRVDAHVAAGGEREVGKTCLIKNQSENGKPGRERCEPKPRAGRMMAQRDRSLKSRSLTAYVGSAHAYAGYVRCVDDGCPCYVRGSIGAHAGVSCTHRRRRAARGSTLRARTRAPGSVGRRARAVTRADAYSRVEGKRGRASCHCREQPKGERYGGHDVCGKICYWSRRQGCSEPDARCEGNLGRGSESGWSAWRGRTCGAQDTEDSVGQRERYPASCTVAARARSSMHYCDCAVRAWTCADVAVSGA